jgi:hypothetical protein
MLYHDLLLLLLPCWVLDDYRLLLLLACWLLHESLLLLLPGWH